MHTSKGNEWKKFELYCYEKCFLDNFVESYRVGKQSDIDTANLVTKEPFGHHKQTFDSLIYFLYLYSKQTNNFSFLMMVAVLPEDDNCKILFLKLKIKRWQMVKLISPSNCLDQ